MQRISIHALLAESDSERLGTRQRGVISIHALLAESDLRVISKTRSQPNFYPRSPCGERPLSGFLVGGINNFYPRSPCGERLASLT